MENRKTGLLLLVLSLSVVACVSRNSVETPDAESVHLQLELSPEQIVSAAIITARIQKHPVSDIIDCEGTIEASSNSMAYVSPPMKGYLKSIRVTLGAYVRQGQVLGILSHPDYIRIQQEYLETKSQYDYFKEDFKRQGELSLEQAVSIKKMQEAQNEYRKTEVRLFALKQQLAFLGINPDSLHVESIQGTIQLISPIEGYVSKIEGTIGILCPEESPVFQVVGHRNLFLHLQVSETYAAQIFPGQDIMFSLPGDPERSYTARLKSSSQSIDENKSIHLHASILDPGDSFLPGMFVDARIRVGSDSIYAVEREALVSENGEFYIFEKSGAATFKAVKVEPGREMDNWIEILEMPKDILDTEIVISGADYLFAKLPREK